MCEWQGKMFEELDADGSGMLDKDELGAETLNP